MHNDDLIREDDDSRCEFKEFLMKICIANGIVQHDKRFRQYIQNNDKFCDSEYELSAKRQLNIAMQEFRVAILGEGKRTKSEISDEEVKILHSMGIEHYKDIAEYIEKSVSESLMKECIDGFEILESNHWTPSVLFTGDTRLKQMLFDVIRINRENDHKIIKAKIDNLCFENYTNSRLDIIKKELFRCEVDMVIKQIIDEAFDAFYLGRFATTVTLLALNWERIILGKIGSERVTSKKATNKLKDQLEKQELLPAFLRFYKKYVVCEDINANVEIPNRNCIAHGKYKEYPCRKQALNAILITEFLVKLD